MGEFEPEVVALCCNWCGYAGADLAGVSRVQYPPNIRIIRLMCSGRVEMNYILKPLQLGADGVMVICCHPGDCHYISGNEKAEKVFEMTKELLHSFGMEDRLRIEYISAAEGTKFGEVVSDFVRGLRRMDPNPMKAVRQKFTTGRTQLPRGDIKGRIDDIIKVTRAYHCLECGKCAASCPVTKMRPEYSPMLTVERALRGFDDEITEDMGIWTCMTCGSCSYRCPSGVDYSGFIRRVRELKAGTKGTCSHGGIFTSIARMMSNPEFNQYNRLHWVSDDLKVRKKGKVLYFTGCLPYFDPILRSIDTPYIEIARSTVRVLNAAGIEPVVLDSERCCGHDLLWSGEEEEVFRDLARINLDAIGKSGAKTVVMSCPECLRTFVKDYPDYMGIKDLGFETMHTSELFADLMDKGKLNLKGTPKDATPMTYQDPCRLGRHLGIFDPPRRVLERLPGVELREMRNNRGNAICCGTSSWLNCGTYSKRIQMGRLREAVDTTAKTMITSCPKCLIHFNCTLTEPSGPDTPPKPDLRIKDLSVLVAEALDMTEASK